MMREKGRQRPRGELPPALESWERELVEKVSGPLSDALRTLEDFKRRRYITRYYLTGSFARGELHPNPKDLDVVVALSNRIYLIPDSTEMAELRERVESLKADGIGLHLSYEPHGRVVNAIEDGSVEETGEVVGERIMEKIPAEKRGDYVLVDTMGVKNPDPVFLKKVYTNLKKLHER